MTCIFIVGKINISIYNEQNITEIKISKNVFIIIDIKENVSYFLYTYILNV